MLLTLITFFPFIHHEMHGFCWSSYTLAFLSPNLHEGSSPCQLSFICLATKTHTCWIMYCIMMNYLYSFMSFLDPNSYLKAIINKQVSGYGSLDGKKANSFVKYFSKN